MLVKLCRNVDVNPAYVASVEWDAQYPREVIVQMANGKRFGITPKYGETVFDAHSRILREVNR